MRKRFGRFAMVLASMCLLGIGSNMVATAEEAVTEAEAAEYTDVSDKGYKIGYCFMTVQDVAIAQIKEDAERRAAERGVEFITASCEMNAQTQVSDVENMITLGVDCIIIQPFDAESLEPVLTQAKEAGIKIMNFGPEGSVYDLYYQNDYSLSAIDSAKNVKEYVDENLGGEANLVYIAQSTNKSGVLKKEYFMGYIEENAPGIELVAEGYGNNTTLGLEQMETILQKTKDIDVVVTTGDGAALGVVEALRAAGIGPDQTVVFSSDVTKLGCEAIMDPENNIIFSQSLDSLVLGSNCIDFAIDLLEGTKGTTEKEKIPFTVDDVTIENAQEYWDEFDARGY